MSCQEPQLPSDLVEKQDLRLVESEEELLQ